MVEVQSMVQMKTRRMKRRVEAREVTGDNCRVSDPDKRYIYTLID